MFTPTGDTTSGSVTIIRIQHGQGIPVGVITPSTRDASPR
jgi:hypothetical protein